MEDGKSGTLKILVLMRSIRVPSAREKCGDTETSRTTTVSPSEEGRGEGGGGE